MHDLKDKRVIPIYITNKINMKKINKLVFKKLVKITYKSIQMADYHMKRIIYSHKSPTQGFQKLAM